MILFGSPVSVGHVRPLMPLARRLIQRGFAVVWAISGDDNEPAEVWRKPLTELGVQFVNVDETARFSRGTAEEFVSTSLASLFTSGKRTAWMRPKHWSSTGSGPEGGLLGSDGGLLGSEGGKRIAGG